MKEFAIAVIYLLANFANKTIIVLIVYLIILYLTILVIFVI